MTFLLRSTAAAIVAISLSYAGPIAAQNAKSASAAADYPARPVRWAVPFPPGASNDIIARFIGQKLTEAWGQQFVVDNCPGAGGSLGAETVAKAMPDVKKRLDQLGLEVGGGSPEDFQRFMTKEAGRLTGLIKAGAVKRE